MIHVIKPIYSNQISTMMNRVSIHSTWTRRSPIAHARSSLSKFKPCALHTHHDLPNAPPLRDLALDASTPPPAPIRTKHHSALPSIILPSLLGLGGMLDSGMNMDGPISVIQAISVLAAIVGFHELGHFAAARLQNIHVSQFSIGMGPALLTFKDKNNIEYFLRALPIGGYVAFPDEDPSSPYAPDDPNLLANRPPKDRALVISAGVIANCILAFAILLAQAETVGTVEALYKPGVRAPIVLAGSAAEAGGVRAGDLILSVAGVTVPADRASVTRVVNVIKENANRDILIQVERGTELLDLHVTPRDEGNGQGGRIGVQLAGNADFQHKKASSLPEAVVMASRDFTKLLKQVTDGLWQLVTNFGATAENISGPVAIVAVGSEVVRSDPAGLFQFGAIINLNLAVVNTIPLPALDGGYMALIALEAARGKKVNQTLERAVMNSGFLLLVGVGIFLVVKDIGKFFR